MRAEEFLAKICRDRLTINPTKRKYSWKLCYSLLNSHDDTNNTHTHIKFFGTYMLLKYPSCILLLYVFFLELHPWKSLNARVHEEESHHTIQFISSRFESTLDFCLCVCVRVCYTCYVYVYVCVHSILIDHVISHMFWLKEHCRYNCFLGGFGTLTKHTNNAIHEMRDIATQ